MSCISHFMSAKCLNENVQQNLLKMIKQNSMLNSKSIGFLALILDFTYSPKCPSHLCDSVTVETAIIRCKSVASFVVRTAACNRLSHPGN